MNIIFEWDDDDDDYSSLVESSSSSTIKSVWNWVLNLRVSLGYVNIIFEWDDDDDSGLVEWYTMSADK